MNLIFVMVLWGHSILGQSFISSDSILNSKIIESGVIHRPLVMDDLVTYESLSLNKKVLLRHKLEVIKDSSNWKHSGEGKLTFSMDKTISGKGSLKIEAPTYLDNRAVGSASDPDYATYGESKSLYKINEENWEEFNRIVFNIYPDNPENGVLNINFTIKNNSEDLKEGYNRQEGDHLIHLENGKWNTCYLDLDEYQRNQISEIGFYFTIKGKNIMTGDSTVFYLDNFELQKVDNPEIVSGWEPRNNSIVYSTTGYKINGKKRALINTAGKDPKQFSLINIKNNHTVFSGSTKKISTSTGDFEIIDFSEFNRKGTFYIKVEHLTTPPFSIDSDIWESSLWKTLNFIFCQRCGYTIANKHGKCHEDLFSEHNGERISYSGGWHDAGDLSQQTLQTADVVYSLLEGYNNLKGKNPILASRMLEEAEWGLDFVLKNRYGDGFRASSMGLLIWLDGRVDSFDDINSVRVQNMTFDNFLYAAYEAYAALTIPDNAVLAEYLRKVAKEDFDYAIQRHELVGFGEFHSFYEHSYNTSKSQYMATASWAASMLFKLTNDPYYAQKAVEFIEYMIACQNIIPIGRSGIKGFFYRDITKKVIVHYNHQSREQVYMQALESLCTVLPNHPDNNKWIESIKSYGEYIKKLMPYTAPYGMLSAGVYHEREAEDVESFDHQHLFMPPDAKELFQIQLKGGVQLDNEHYLKRFPVWFSIFNGNMAIHLSMGKAAVICGKILNDQELKDIGLEQLYWVVGFNPFGQSLIRGEGNNFPQMDNFSSGMAIGEMPVGIRTLGNLDVPYWPQTNTSCYKEVWVTSAGKWISLASEF
ncbi:glycoside hydrolase family 9 protein [Robertkochia solimangrovi]|uniref:glycoside hydrolase family 9 protein n=1 Tax=Robertkochia solimangrovi TaxID=2213046 RepID=UPI0018F01627|nr:glycoside hydrolase family 9 protein [Robertkochia solimangrovi]